MHYSIVDCIRNLEYFVVANWNVRFHPLFLKAPQHVIIYSYSNSVVWSPCMLGMITPVSQHFNCQTQLSPQTYLANSTSPLPIHITVITISFLPGKASNWRLAQPCHRTCFVWQPNYLMTTQYIALSSTPHNHHWLHSTHTTQAWV